MIISRCPSNLSLVLKLDLPTKQGCPTDLFWFHPFITDPYIYNNTQQNGSYSFWLANSCVGQSPHKVSRKFLTKLEICWHFQLIFSVLVESHLKDSDKFMDKSIFTVVDIYRILWLYYWSLISLIISMTGWTITCSKMFKLLPLVCLIRLLVVTSSNL